MKKKEVQVNEVAKHVLLATNETVELIIEKQYEKIVAIVTACLATYSKDGQFIFMGNGGSAANASHFAADFTKRPIWHVKGARPISTRALTDSGPSAFMWANDSGFPDVFRNQLMSSQLTDKDVVFAFSGSGNSENVLKAVKHAKKVGATVIAITGFDGGKLAKMADISIIVPPEPNRRLETDDNGAVMGAYEAVTDVIMHGVIEAFREGVKAIHQV